MTFPHYIQVYRPPPRRAEAFVATRYGVTQRRRAADVRLGGCRRNYCGERVLTQLHCAKEDNDQIALPLWDETLVEED
jgi:hypothetical protein